MKLIYFVKNMSSLNNNNNRNSEILTVGQHFFTAVDYGKCSCSGHFPQALRDTMLNKKLICVCVRSFVYCEYILCQYVFTCNIRSYTRNQNLERGSKSKDYNKYISVIFLRNFSVIL